MVSRLNTAEGVASGTVVTAVNSATSGDAFDTFSGDPMFSNEWAAFGTQSFKFTGAAATTADLVRWGTTGGPLVATAERFSAYIRLPAYPTASTCALVQFRHASGAVASLQMNTSGRLLFIDSASNGAPTLYDTAVGQGFYFTAEVIRGTTTSNGTLRVEIRSLDGATLHASFTSSTLNTGTADLVSVQFGRLTMAAGATVYVDQPRLETGSGTLIPPWEEPDPPPTLGTEVVTAGSMVTFPDIVWPGGSGGTISASPSTGTVPITDGIFLPANPDGSVTTYTITATDTASSETATVDVDVSVDASADVIESVVWNGTAWE